ncbi:hypothetical protein PRIPAC_86021, partial [Pristionchus pacificus]|uniref:Uncharacterized protein n=1 Tax=Pristionchus pacificus TaxID=54126 RepID=A0A2A6BP19_PRIPA
MVLLFRCSIMILLLVMVPETASFLSMLRALQAQSATGSCSFGYLFSCKPVRPSSQNHIELPKYPDEFSFFLISPYKVQYYRDRFYRHRFAPAPPPPPPPPPPHSARSTNNILMPRYRDEDRFNRHRFATAPPPPPPPPPPHSARSTNNILMPRYRDELDRFYRHRFAPPAPRTPRLPSSTNNI